LATNKQEDAASPHEYGRAQDPPLQMTALRDKINAIFHGMTQGGK